MSVMLDKNDMDNQYRCQTCSKTFTNIDQLYAHQNELGHLELKQTPRGPGYLCWKKGCNQYFKTAQALQVHFREIHAKRPSVSSADCNQYSHQCSQCTLAFQSADKLQSHNQYHLVNSVTTCSICTQCFHSIALLRRHYESAHTELTASELAKCIVNLSANVAALQGSADYIKLLVKSSQSSATTAATTTSSASETSSSATSVVPLSLELFSSADHEMSMQDVSMVNEDENDLYASCSDSPEDVSGMADGEERGGDADRSEHSSVYREEQFMEDFINSQAMAEGSYEDPSRKFKCHRCKAAFTKQNYLTAHNKTLQHRRGDKISYPMERYLDPNRPYKCDVCKESFTQKNILLVHYNSVSHLHKLKQAAQQGTLPPSVSVGTPTTNSSLQQQLSLSTPSESELKPYRCNICKVAYNQGSTLDIHIRSVAHQTRASKIHELAMTGQIDISQMLIEQPDLSKASTQQVQALTDMISQTQAQVTVGSPLQHSSLLLGGIPGYSMLPGMQLPTVTSNSLTSPSSSSAVSIASETDTSRSHSKSSHRGNEEQSLHSKSIAEAVSSENKGFLLPIGKKEPLLESKESESRSSEKSKLSESQLFNISKSINIQHKESPIEKQLSNQSLPHRCSNCNSFFITEEALQIHQQIYCNMPAAASKPRYICRFKPQVHRNLLQNFGFECVMQFNEYNQNTDVKKEKTEKENGDNEPVNMEIKVEPNYEERVKIDLPEINRSTCLSCNKDFSSVWVLKSHQEEVHKDLVPIDAVEGFSEKFREDFDKKLPLDEPPTPTSGGLSLSFSSPTITDSLVNQEMPPPPPPPLPIQAQFDMSQIMPMFGMMPMPMPMNLMGLTMQTPLVSMMFPQGADMSNLMPPVTLMESNFTSTQQQLQAAQNQKRVRTRISDEQLKILRGYFDINNSPSEEQIQQMSEQSGLPPKVIKHWFRNTLFKERQRNKDSPYNFNNPPSTSLDLEEYEKTGIIPTFTPIVVKQEPKDEFGGDDDDNDDESVAKNDKEIESELEKEQPEADKMEPLIKLETPKLELPEDKREYETYSNSSTPSTTSSITSTPNCSLPSTPTTEDLLRHEFSSGSMSKRANRTRFTDYQIKMLQDYFDQNAYPKDDELDHLSKMLNLSPRVIVVWFQNARQKARKVYENQPAAETKEEDTSSYQRTPGLNYQCKKCQAVFQRYYELIKHQKRPCLPENNNTTTQSLMHRTDDDSNSSSLSQDDLSQSGSFTDDNLMSEIKESPNDATHIPTFNCDKCEASYNRLDLWQEHQKVHSLNPSLFPSFSTSSAFGMLQTLAQQEDSKIAAAAKRKIECEDDQDDQPRDKRLRTTILPEQLDYLYQKYQQDCNPSRKQLESISSDVGLKKRVVQVWFQNTRARERKGQYRAHQQLIHKRCPFCRALFRAKSAMESHLATKHPDEMAKNEINVDAIPDAVMDGSNPTSPQPHSATPSGSGHPGDFSKLLSPSMQQYLPFLPSPSNIGLAFSPDPLQLSMKQIYEDSFKKYINELSGGASHSSSTPAPPQSRHNSESSSRRTETESVPSTHTDEEAPLDLSKPIKVSTDTDKSSDGPSTDLSERSADDHTRRISMDDSFSETLSESADMEMCDDSIGSPSSPGNGSLGGRGYQNKRYRTQMTSKQVKIMKLLFVDYKTPTMVECEMLGSEIGLQKRVVQVWFQNARAKEKKSKLAYTKTFGTDVDFTKPPEECTFCNFKYSHKFTVQDHIFTKKHINNVRAFIQSKSDAEREMSDPTGMSTLLRHQRDLDHSRKTWPDMSSSTPHLSQLQAMGMNAMSVPDATGIAVGHPLSLGTGHAGSDTSTPKKNQVVRKDEPESRKKEAKVEASSSSKQHEQAQAMASAEMAMNAQMMALGGYLPGMDPSFLQYMYPGLPGYFPGMGLPMMQPGFFPGMGAEHMMAYDPLSFGTPLPLLQIPQQAIKIVSEKLEDPRASLAQYTQDCKSLSDLKPLVTSADYSCAHETFVDVGYICKKCQIVYPAKEACVNHQRMVCFPGGKIPENIKAMLKLEQIQFGCRACSDKFSTLYEFKIHCQMETHKVKAGKMVAGAGHGKVRLDTTNGAVSTLTSPSSRNKQISSSSSSSDPTNRHGHSAHPKPKME